MRPLLTVFLVAVAPAMAIGSPDPKALDRPKFYALIALGAHYQYGGQAGQGRKGRWPLLDSALQWSAEARSSGVAVSKDDNHSH
jgi:hypothetical protein